MGGAIVPESLLPVNSKIDRGSKIATGDRRQSAPVRTETDEKAGKCDACT
jgi:hypothetical protein